MLIVSHHGPGTTYFLSRMALQRKHSGGTFADTTSAAAAPKTSVPEHSNGVGRLSSKARPQLQQLPYPQISCTRLTGHQKQPNEQSLVLLPPQKLTLKFSRPNRSNQRSSCMAYMLFPTWDTYKGVSKNWRGLQLFAEPRGGAWGHLAFNTELVTDSKE